MARDASEAPAASRVMLAALTPMSTCLVAKLAKQTTNDTTATATNSKPDVCAELRIVRAADCWVMRW